MAVGQLAIGTTHGLRALTSPPVAAGECVRDAARRTITTKCEPAAPFALSNDKSQRLALRLASRNLRLSMCWDVGQGGAPRWARAVGRRERGGKERREREREKKTQKGEKSESTGGEVAKTARHRTENPSQRRATGIKRWQGCQRRDGREKEKKRESTAERGWDTLAPQHQCRGGEWEATQGRESKRHLRWEDG